MKWLLFLLIFLCGCITSFDSLDGKLKKKYWAKPCNQSVQAMKLHYFTDEAQIVMDNIPCVFGFTISGSYVVGANFWGTFAGILTGSGYSRKCVIDEESLWSFGPEAILHEYIHHLDDIGRDGEQNLIDLEEFKKAYVRMATDTKWAGLVLYAEPRANNWFTNLFGIGELSEHIAYVGGRMAVQESGPDYMWKVFRKVLRREKECCEGGD